MPGCANRTSELRTSARSSYEQQHQKITQESPSNHNQHGGPVRSKNDRGTPTSLAIAMESCKFSTACNHQACACGANDYNKRHLITPWTRHGCVVSPMIATHAHSSRLVHTGRHVHHFPCPLHALKGRIAQLAALLLEPRLDGLCLARRLDLQVSGEPLGMSWDLELRRATSTIVALKLTPLATQSVTGTSTCTDHPIPHFERGPAPGCAPTTRHPS